VVVARWRELEVEGLITTPFKILLANSVGALAALASAPIARAL